jgi:hypothetical protein
MPVWAAFVLVAAVGATGCAGTGPIEVPSSLPNVTRQDFVTLRWTLLREGRVARAVGVAESSGAGQWDAVVELRGVDDAGRTVSRGSTMVRPGFARGPASFEATVVETGRETAFRLHVVQAQQYSRPGR